MMERVHSSVSKRSLVNSVLRAFSISMLFAVIGMYVGTFLPASAFLPLIVVEIALVIFTLFIRRKKVGFLFLYGFTLVSGATTYPTIAHYAAVSGAHVVISVFVATCVVFAVMAIIGATRKKDLSALGQGLTAALLALIIVELISLFIPMGSPVVALLGGIGAAIFSLYVLYDFNQLKQGRFSEEDVPMLALNLYLDFINLFLNLLQFIGELLKND